MRRMLLRGLSLLVLAGCTGAPASGWRAPGASYPIDKLQGHYTVAAFQYRDVVEKDGSVSARAVTLASSMAYYLRHQQDMEAYVADLGAEAIVVVGSYPNWDAAAFAADEVRMELDNSSGLRQMRAAWVTPQGQAANVQSWNPQLVMQPFAVDLKVLKDRVCARREHRISFSSRFPEAPPHEVLERSWVLPP